MKNKALILLNMGGPNTLDEVKVFLHNMFNDKNIITTKSSLLRKFIAFMIVKTRTKKAQEVYKKLGGKSPIVDYTKILVSKLQDALDDDVYVDFAMRYTPPFACDVIQKIKQKNIKEIFLIPLYPQYSTTTTKSSLEDFMGCLSKEGLHVDVKYVESFFENKYYNKAILSAIKDTLDKEESKKIDLIFSAHSLPKKIINNGDVYELHINKHIKILKDMLKKNNIEFNDIHLAYQSKIGPVEWLEPSLEEKLRVIKNKKVIIYPIAFCIDNSETKFELSMEYKELADTLGFDLYRVCQSPNDNEFFIEALKDIYKNMK